MIDKIAMIIPTRQRPEAIGQLLESFSEHATRDLMDIVVTVDGDPENYYEYLSKVGLESHSVVLNNPVWQGMVAVVNTATRSLAGLYTHIGFMGDDHRFRTSGFDYNLFMAARRQGTGIVYPNDGFQGSALPTSFVISSDLVRFMGFLFPPILRHNYVDNFILDLGVALDRIQYEPDVLVEHLHPVAGKAETDESYETSSHHYVRLADAYMYDKWKKQCFPHLVDQAKKHFGTGRDLDIL